MLVGKDPFKDEDFLPFRVFMAGKAALCVIADQARDWSGFAALAVKRLAPYRLARTRLPGASRCIDGDNNRKVGVDIGRGAFHLHRSAQACYCKDSSP